MHTKGKSNGCYQQLEDEGRISRGILGKLFSHMKANWYEVVLPAEAAATYKFRRAGCKGKGAHSFREYSTPRRLLSHRRST